jgi:hypothetical protein
VLLLLLLLRQVLCGPGARGASKGQGASECRGGGRSAAPSSTLPEANCATLLPASLSLDPCVRGTHSTHTHCLHRVGWRAADGSGWGCSAPAADLI